MTRAIHRAGVLVLLCGLAACASQGPAIKSPIVELSGVKLEQLSFREQTFRLRFDVQNPNPFPLPVKRVRYRVQLEDQSFASGETPARFTVPANGDGSFELGVELDLVSTATSLAPLLRAGSDRPLAYQLDGSLAVGIPFAPPLAFRQQGTILVR